MLSTIRTALGTLISALASLVGRRGKRRVWVLVVGLLAIVGWQATFGRASAKLDHTYHVFASTGVHDEQHYFFYLYHLGLYPLATDAPILHDTKNEAERLLRTAPDKLKQDTFVTFRSGDRGRVYLFYVDALLRHDAIKPSLRPASVLAFVTALCGLFTAMWWVQRPALGALLVVLLGSNPFQLHSVYSEENVFSWAITTMIAVLAIHVPLMGSRPASRRYPWIAAVATGLFLATVRTVRSEGMPIILGAVLAYLTLAGASWWKRLALAATLAVTFNATGALYTRAILHKFEVAQKVVRDVGGEPYEGPLPVYHEFWHAVFCGLGDFDTKYGYAWDDRVAYRYALPYLEKLAGHPLKLNVMSAPQAQTYDKAGKYPVYFSETPGYHDIIRDKILGDIKRDPAWYVDILVKRVRRLLTDTSPVSLSFSTEQFQTKSGLLGWACAPLLLFLLGTRRHFLAKLLVFSLPLTITPLVIYSDRGMSYYSCFHIFGAAIFLMLMASGARRWLTSSDGI